MKVKNRLMTSIAFVVLFVFSSMANATSDASIIYNESESGGSWKYDYTFYNWSNAGENLYAVYLDFGSPTLLTSYNGLPVPTGWFGTLWEGQHVSNNIFTMSTNAAYDIASLAPSNSLSGFSFTVDHKIGNISYRAEFRNSSGYTATSGTTSAYVAPVVPEPISSALFLIGGTLFIIRNRWKRRRQFV